MANRTKTYIAADWTGDRSAVEQLHKWNSSKYWGLSFHDAHESAQARDGSLNCSIKASLQGRLDITKTFVLVVGNGTLSRRAGNCYYCHKYENCSKQSNKSYIQYECDKAAHDYADGDIKQIVVLYNASTVDKSKCPDVLKSIGTHKEMKTSGVYDYSKVKTALGA